MCHKQNYAIAHLMSGGWLFGDAATANGGIRLSPLKSAKCFLSAAAVALKENMLKEKNAANAKWQSKL